MADQSVFCDQTSKGKCNLLVYTDDCASQYEGVLKFKVTRVFRPSFIQQSVQIKMHALC